MIALTFCFSTMFGLLVTSLSDRTDTGRESPTAAKTLALIVHDPIYIDGTSGFTGPNASTGVTRGSGAESDPYIIEGWEIWSFPSYGIYVGNVNVHFVVQDCSIHNGGWSEGSSILLLACSNGTIRNCTCYSNAGKGIYLDSSDGNSLIDNACSYNHYYGIVLSYSSDCCLINNSCSNSEYGIYISGDDNLLTGNVCSDNRYGIRLEISANSSLVGNTCLRNEYGTWLFWATDNSLLGNICSANSQDGIELVNSEGNHLTNNTCSDNDWNGILVYSSHGNSLVNNACTGIGGYGYAIWIFSSDNNSLIGNMCSQSAIYLLGAEGNSLISNSCMIYLSDSANNSLVNNTCSNLFYGILIYDSSDNNCLTSNTILNNEYGIYISSSSNNSLVNNMCSANQDGIRLTLCNDTMIQMNRIVGNSRHGISIYSGSNNMIWNNTFDQNNGSGDTYDPLHIQAYDAGTENWWNSMDGYGNYWGDWTTPDVAPPDGIVDIPYQIDGSSDAQDNYPLTTTQTLIPEFGMMPLVVIGLLITLVLVTGARRKNALG